MTWFASLWILIVLEIKSYWTSSNLLLDAFHFSLINPNPEGIVQLIGERESWVWLAVAHSLIAQLECVVSLLVIMKMLHLYGDGDLHNR